MRLWWRSKKFLKKMLDAERVSGADSTVKFVRLTIFFKKAGAVFSQLLCLDIGSRKEYTAPINTGRCPVFRAVRLRIPDMEPPRRRIQKSVDW